MPPEVRPWLRSPYGLPSPGPHLASCSVIEPVRDVINSETGGGLWQIATAGGDQTAVQRFMATSSARAARRSYLINAITVIVVTVVQALSPNEPL